jgi:hypothetical protein
MWNGTIYPISRAVTARGAIWSQGEANSHRNRHLYECQLIELIKEWRSSFLEAAVPVPLENNWAFPFGIVQVIIREEILTRFVFYSGVLIQVNSKYLCET